MSAEKRPKVIKAARTVFIKYGYKRTSMDDIAKAAGMSRPALYLVFKNKAEILKGILREVGRQHVEDINAGIGTIKSPIEKMKFVFETWSVKSIDELNKSNEARELLESGAQFAGEVLDENYALLESILTDVISEMPNSDLPKALSAKQVAHVLASSLRGFKLVSKTSAELRQMVNRLLMMTFRS